MCKMKMSYESKAAILPLLRICCGLVLVVSVSGRVNLHSVNVAHRTFEAIYQFGDSISDTGNSIRESPNSGLCTDFPYGESYFHYVTGRCSDGLIMADYYATAFGLPFLNPYLDGDANFTNGADFSVAGASALNVEFLESKNISAGGTNSSLAVQIGWFETLLNSTCSSQSECRSKVENSLFLMETIGGNDYNYAFGDDKSFEVIYELVPDVINAITNGIKDMITLGAVYVVVPTVIPFGCIPYFLSLVNSTDSDLFDDLGCVKAFNEVAEFHNEKLYNATKELKVLYPNATLIYADYYSAITTVIKNAAALGFDEEQKFAACCGSGDNPYNFDWDNMCGTIGVPVCPNPSERISWDGLHFTQQLYKYVSQWMLEKTIIPQLSAASAAASL